MMPRPLFLKSLTIYAVISSFVSICQADYIGADFVAYVTVARRAISQPMQAITGYWSPLFSWLMIPLLSCGIDDLIAGRLVLLTSGAIYLWAVDRFTRLICPGNSPGDRLIQIGMMACSVIQASIWATYLLDPDLLANAAIYLYFGLIFQSEAESSPPRRIFIAGLFAGIAYLAKAYMLPFCLLHFLLTRLVLRSVTPRTSRPPILSLASLRIVCLFGMGFGLMAGSWLFCLSAKYGHPTFSTAGAANHANVSRENFSKDPLWNPGLTPDFIFEPHLAPDWSPFQDPASFLYQIQLILHNTGNCVGLIPLWIAVFFVSLWVIRSRRIELSSGEKTYFVWSTMTVFVYCAGYTAVNLEARYIVPTVVPMLCLSSLIMGRAFLVVGAARVDNSPSQLCSTADPGDIAIIRPTQTSFLTGAWAATAVVLLVSLTSGIDIHGLIRNATAHPQSIKMKKFRIIAEQLAASKIPDLASAANNWHLGLYIAYAANRLPNYWGTPLAQTEQQIFQDLDSKDVKIYFRFFIDAGEFASGQPEIPPEEGHLWTRLLTIRHPELSPWAVQVDIRH